MNSLNDVIKCEGCGRPVSKEFTKRREGKQYCLRCLDSIDRGKEGKQSKLL